VFWVEIPKYFFKKHLSDSFHRHMLNVSWENTDFSFNSDGYLVNPAMIIITLDRGRQWDKVKFVFFVCVLEYFILKVAPPMVSSISMLLRRFHCLHVIQKMPLINSTHTLGLLV